ncbi:MAG TPA: apolipoprotein N-acyltransferase [Pirellulales bacterium]|nr:apolipoprotein N-acyltransferase [Pirellulales bacterium]
MPASGRMLLPAVIGTALAVAAQPPLGFWPLAWVAPAVWIALALRLQLPGKRPYTSLWVAGMLYWLTADHWLRLPHPVTGIGWVALSCYFGIYLPLFVALLRVAVLRLKWPVAVSAATIWTGFELAQAHLLSGFNMGSLEHSQYQLLPLIQISDLGGQYLVTFVVVFGAAAIYQTWTAPSIAKRALALLPALLLVAAACGYGQWRIATTVTTPGPVIGLVQGSVNTVMKQDPAEQELIHQQYCELSALACSQRPGLDLLVWPETMFRWPYVNCTDDAQLPTDEDWTLPKFKAQVAENHRIFRQLVPKLGKPMLLGVEAIDYTSAGYERYNSALLVEADGRFGPRYDKSHPVPFGEYVPLAKTFPVLYRLTPLGSGIEWGTRTTAFRVAGHRLAANICYESALAHVIRRQVVALVDRGEEPDVLVNLTNDGWFRGSTELDMHLACDVFRAVECRKPFVIAANTGFSAAIDSLGRVVQQSKRGQNDVIIADVKLDGRHSLYMKYGDLPAGACLAVCGVLASVGLTDRFRRKAADNKT